MGVPKYPFVVERTYRVGSSKLATERKNYETLPPCLAVRDEWRRSKQTTSVRVMMILDEAVVSQSTAALIRPVA